MRKITGKHLCIILLAFPLCWAEEKRGAVKRTDNTTVQSQVKTSRVFARQKNSTPNEILIPKQKAARLLSDGCSRLMDSCSPLVPCCDPCASCHCRLFNTICHCWRMNPICMGRKKISKMRRQRYT